MTTDKPRSGGNWTEGRYRSFITSILRGGSRRWAPIYSTKKKARVDRGKYRCAACDNIVPATKVVKGKRVNNVFVDHINPVVDPSTGFTTWDDFIDRLFCEEDNLQVLCRTCHDNKTDREKQISKKRIDNDRDPTL